MDDREAHLLIIRSASRTSKRRLRNFERTSLALRASLLRNFLSKCGLLYGNQTKSHTLSLSSQFVFDSGLTLSIES